MDCAKYYINLHFQGLKNTEFYLSLDGLPLVNRLDHHLNCSQGV